jgi:predicted porin
MADINVAVQNSGAGPFVSVASGGFNGSRLGLKGTAPLSETVSAVFLAESGLNFDTGLSGNANSPNGLNDSGASSGGHLGNGPQLWSRQIYLGVTTPYGTITGGRQYTPNYIIAAGIVLPYPGMFGVTAGLTTQVGLPTRVNNSIYYTSPTISGLRLQAGGYAGNENNTEGTAAASATTSTNAKAGRGGDAALFFKQGGLSLNGGAWYVYNTAWVTAGETELSIKKGYQVGATYNVLGYFTLYGEFAQGKISGGNYENVTRTLSKTTSWGASLMVPYGKAKVAFNYATLNDRSLNNKDADQLGVQAWYDIQPKSHVYVAWGYMLNHRNSTYNVVDSASNIATPTRAGAEVRALQVGFDQDF